MTSSQLINLSVELLQMICTQFENDFFHVPSDTSEDRVQHDEARQAQKDLISLVKTCRVTCVVATPILARTRYSSRSMVWKPKMGLMPYARHILQDHNLASREIHFSAEVGDPDGPQYGSPRGPEDGNPVGPVQNGDAEILHKEERRLGLVAPVRPSQWIQFGDLVDSQDRISSDLRLRWMTAVGLVVYTATGLKAQLLDIILMGLPNLTHVTLATELFPLFLKPGSLPALKRVKLIPRHDIEFSDFGILEGLINAAPSMEALEVHWFDACYKDMRLDNLRSLELLNACFSQPHLGHLLSRCEKLESFTYYSGMIAQDQAYPKDHVQALWPARSSLQTLDITVFRTEWEKEYVDRDVEDPDPISPEDLYPFVALRTCTICERH